MSLDNPTDIAESLSFFTWLTGDPSDVNKAYQDYEDVTVDDIMRVAKKYFTKENLTYGTLSPESESEAKDLLK